MPKDILPLLREQAALSVDGRKLLALYVGPAAVQTGALPRGAEESPDSDSESNSTAEGAEAPTLRKGAVLVKYLLAIRLDRNVTKLNDEMLYEYLATAVRRPVVRGGHGLRQADAPGRPAGAAGGQVHDRAEPPGDRQEQRRPGGGHGGLFGASTAARCR